MTTAQAAHRPGSDWRETAARVGLTAKGALYLTVGVMASLFALGRGGGDQASQTGAIDALAAQSYGKVIVGVLAIGLALHGLWQLLAAFTGDPVEGDGAKERAKFSAKAVIYLGLAGVSASKLVSAGSSGGGGGGGGGTDQASSMILGLPGGVWIASAIGLVIVGIGIYEIVRHGRDATFMERIGRTDGTQHVRTNVRRAGRLGYTALGIVSVITGGFFVVAAVQHDPSQSKGMSEAFQSMKDTPWGPWLLGFVAVGVVLYGVFCLAEARYRRAA